MIQQKHLFDGIRQKTVDLLNGYIPTAEILDHVDEYIVEPGLGTASGAMGALLLSYAAYEGK